jgi:hypothetical protein
MSASLSIETIGLFLLFVLPGLIAIRVYRLVMPAKEVDGANSLIDGLFYTSINLLLGAPVLWVLVFGHDPNAYPGRWILAGFLVLLVGPVVWPLLYAKAIRSKWVARRIQVPYPTAWDFFFDKRRPVFALVHLEGGNVIGGYWGGESYAGSFPNDGDVYLEAVYTVDAAGRFGDAVPFTRGILLRKEQYTYIELFDVPERQEAA